MNPDVHIDELDHLITRITRANAELWVSWNGVDYEVRDAGNDDELCVHGDDLQKIVAWARTYAIQTDGATVDEESVQLAYTHAHSVRVPTLRIVPSEAVEG